MSRFKGVRRISCAVLAAAMVMVSGGTAVLPVQAATSSQEATNLKSVGSIETCKMNDFSNWRTGWYIFGSGIYGQFGQRICLDEYKTFSSDKYKVTISNTNFKLTIREMSSSGVYLKSVTVGNGDTYVPSASAKYLAVTLYNAVSESGMSYGYYKNAFANGFCVSFTAVNQGESETGSKEDDTQNNQVSGGTTIDKANSDTYVEDLDFSNIKNWQSGCYDWNTGIYGADSKRLCLKDYVEFKADRYQVKVGSKDYKLLVRELDANQKLLKSNVFTDKDIFTPKAATKYLAIGIYRSSGEHGITYKHYVDLFESGFYAGLEPVSLIQDGNKAPEQDDNEKIEIDEDFSVSDSSLSEKPSVKDNDTLFKEELLEMLENGDTSVHNIAQFGYDWEEVSKLYKEVINNEGRIPFNSCFNMFYSTTRDTKGIIQTIQLRNIDSGYLQRYHSMKKIVEDLVKQSEGMSELEKVVFVHDYIVSHCSYSTSGDLTNTAAGVLVNGRALCTGYASAMVVVLQEMGVEAEMVVPSTMPHAWAKVKVNGHWYHADPTWDDTRSTVKGQVSHAFLLKTDKEFQSGTSNRHYGWSGTISTDTSFENWEVHNIVGEIKPSDGSWYYIDAKTGMKKEVLIR